MNIWKLTFSSGIFFITMLLLPMVNPSFAAVLKFDPSSVTTDVDETFQLDVIVDTEGAEVLGVDALFEYDDELLEVESITDGEFLEIGIKEFDVSGKVYIAGVVSSPGEAVEGEGVLATVQFKALANGTDEIKYTCETGETNESNISENSTDAPDLIQCSLNGEAVISVGTGDSSTPTPVPDTEDDDDTPEQLPETGIVEDFITFAIVGGILLLIGVGAKRLV